MPLSTKDIYPEVDDYAILIKEKRRYYQQLFGMTRYAVIIGRPNIYYALLSLSRFSSRPRAGYIHLPHHAFGLSKQFPREHIVINSSSMSLSQLHNIEQLQADFVKEYVDANTSLGIC